MKEDFAQKCQFKTLACMLLRCGHASPLWSCFKGGVEWPCHHAGTAPEENCQQLDLSACPRHWADRGGGHCAPAGDVRSSCKDTLVAGMTPVEKVSFAAACGTEWPCIGESV